MGSTVVHGEADEGFGPVVDAFTENFETAGELGAACTVYHRGRVVVDVYGGIADATTGAPWQSDTLAVGFSVTKGLMALCAYLAHQRGLLDFDAPVASVWPEFAVNGKQDILIRDLFTHRAGLIALDRDLTVDDVARWTPVIEAVEEQHPQWPPGTAFGYHALTYGFLTGEVLRRVTGLRPGPLVAEYLATPLGVDAWIGLPPEQEPRVARIEPGPPADDPETLAFVQELLSKPTVVRSITLSGAFPALVGGDGPDLNSPEVRRLELPAGNGILDSRALATIYAAAVSTVDGHPRLLTDDSIADAVTVRSADDPWPDAMTSPGIRFSTGFLIDGIPYRPLLSDGSFGHDGASGSLGFADAAAEIGFGYLNNRMSGADDERANSLTAALRRCLG